MRRTVLAAVAAFTLMPPTPASGQFFPPPGHRRPVGFIVGPTVPGVGFGFGYYSRSVWAGPGWGPAFAPFPPSVVVVPQVVVVPPPVIVGGGVGVEEPPEPVVPAAARRNDLIVIEPRRNAGLFPPNQERTIPHIDRIVMPRRDMPVFGFDAFARSSDFQKAKADAGKPEPDPVAEAVRLAREAFAAEQYGRAVERFDAAIAARPADPLPYFLKAQAHVAAGQYADAVAAIREGMKRAPDWPAGDFKPVELYGANPERFAAHLAELRRAVADNPAEPALAFLLGYELWFAGERAEAVKQFQAAAKAGRDGPIIERFLREAEKPR
jgi:hypothetical protein